MDLGFLRDGGDWTVCSSPLFVVDRKAVGTSIEPLFRVDDVARHVLEGRKGETGRPASATSNVGQAADGPTEVWLRRM